jgi:hypothetical protein
MRMRIQVNKMTRIHPDPDPQHWYFCTHDSDISGILQKFSIAFAFLLLFSLPTYENLLFRYYILPDTLPLENLLIDDGPKKVRAGRGGRGAGRGGPRGSGGARIGRGRGRGRGGPRGGRTGGPPRR